jgi:phosphoserine phosphatase
VRISPVPTEEYEAWVARHRESRHIITLFGPCVQAEHLERLGRVTRTFGLNVAVVTRLSGRVSLENPCAENNACIELGVRGTPSDPVAMRRELLAIANELQCDIGFQEDNVWRRNRRMIAFDMDSTLIQAEVIDELARAYGKLDEVSKITEAAMNGELDFDQSLRRRLGLLKGLRTDVMDSIAHNLQLTPGAERLIRTVRALGYKTAILSGGFTYFGHYIQRKLGIDYVHANELEIEDGKLTGNVIGPIVNGARKAQLLQELALRENIVLDQVIAVGDGANDLPMLGVAGLGIAFHAKPRVRESAKQQISTAGLDGILYLIGVRDREVEPLSYTSHC